MYIKLPDGSSLNGFIKQFSFLQTCDFVDDATNAHCVVAGMKYFGLQKTDGTPQFHKPPNEDRSNDAQEVWLYRCAGEIIDKYVMAGVEEKQMSADTILGIFKIENSDVSRGNHTVSSSIWK